MSINIIESSVPAPIILFVYNRQLHTQRTIEALKKNELAHQSELIIYSDAAKNDQAWLQVQEVRDYIKTVAGFKSVKIIERERNWGLATNIIDGVGKVVSQYGKVIVLEDDIVTSSTFLSFMNQALNYYEDQKKVWHISGWNYPIQSVGTEDAFFWRVMNCWGWATWADRWQYFDKNPQRLAHDWSHKEKNHFDLDSSGVFWPQVLSNIDGKMNTWAIFWYSTIYENKGLCLNPVETFVDNIGFDGSGVHCGKSIELMSSDVKLNNRSKFDWPNEITESTQAVEAIKLYYKKQKKPFIVRVINKLARLTIGKNVRQ
ncbi:glycosyltransferase [Marinomonas sp.]|uniref:glycosyltransferase n=1 Tax=Marinomonas sp. TaxID=1904862 RepID=UPI003F98E239